MPVVILAVAAGVAWWGSQSERRRSGEIQQRVRDICTAIASGKDVKGTINAGNSFVEGQVIEAIKRAFPSPELASSMEIAVKPGDVSGIRAPRGDATHSVLLSQDGMDVLGLRVRYRAEGRPIEIIGFWIPNPQ